MHLSSVYNIHTERAFPILNYRKLRFDEEKESKGKQADCEKIGLDFRLWKIILGAFQQRHKSTQESFRLCFLLIIEQG